MLDIKHPLYQEDIEYVIKKLDFNKLRKSFILVTGATGLIGSFIVDTLLYLNQIYSLNITIVCMGRQLSRIKNRFNYCRENELVMLEQDICKSLDINENIDYIIHAASNADPQTYAQYPTETIKTNVLGTINMLDYAASHKSCKLLFMSTMEVYGEGISDIFDENDYGRIDFNKIRSGYPESKRVAELLCRSYHKQYNVQSVVVRLGYIYGPTMRKEDSKVVAQFIKNGLEGKDIILKSKGNQLRSYCYVADAVSGIFKALLEGQIGETYNIANENSTITIRQLADEVANIVGVNVIYENPDEIECIGYSKALDNVLSEAKLKKLDWNPQYSIASGIERTIKILYEEKSIC